MRAPLLAAACLLLAACQSAPVKASQPLVIPAARHDLALLAAAGTLRDFGFRVERSDARMGVVSALPGGIPTSGEWWRGNAPVGGGAWEARANLQDLRHRVRFTLVPSQRGADGLPAAGTAYRLSAEAAVERLDTPTRRVTAGWTTQSSALAGSFSDPWITQGSAPSSRLREVPEPWRSRGVEDAKWQPIGRDADLEQALLDDVEKRMR